MSRTILVVAAHTDDEALGCGGTIARLVADGYEVHALFMTDGVGSRHGNEASKERRRMAAERAQAILGIKQTYHFDFPDNRMDVVPFLEVVQAVENIVAAVSPQIIYTHHYGDLNIDHRIVHKAVITACRPQPGHPVREIYGFEVLSSTEWVGPQSAPFMPSVYVDISDFLAIKLDALRAYAEEMRPAPHSRSLEHVEYLARHRGYSVGVTAAEAFVPVRILRA